MATLISSLKLTLTQFDGKNVSMISILNRLRRIVNEVNIGNSVILCFATYSQAIRRFLNLMLILIQIDQKDLINNKQYFI